MPYHHVKENVIYMTHESGFFSCSSVRLDAVITYFNEHNFTLPESVDTTGSYTWYKKNKGDDVFDFFENPGSIVVEPEREVVDYNQTYQWIDYSKLNFSLISPFVKKYFTPSRQIYDIVDAIETKYNIVDYSNMCVLFYRGNDKIPEAKYRNKKCSGYSEYMTHAKKIIEIDPSTRFLIQSDETDFIDKIMKDVPGSFMFSDEIRHMKCNPRTTVDKVFPDNHGFSKKFLAITLIMAKCNRLVMCNGNCGIWTVFYRGNIENVVQLSPS